MHPFDSASGTYKITIETHDAGFSTSSFIQPEEWYHAAVTYDDNVNLYVDGELLLTESLVTPSFNGTDFRIGRHNVTYPQWLIGAVDDVSARQPQRPALK